MSKKTAEIVAGALYAFASSLTTRKDTITAGGNHVAGPMAEAVEAFCRANGLTGEPAVRNWQDLLKLLPPVVNDKLDSDYVANLQADADRRAAAAVRTLTGKGYSYEGGEQWKPPLGPTPAFAEAFNSVDDDVGAFLKKSDVRVYGGAPSGGKSYAGMIQRAMQESIRELVGKFVAENRAVLLQIGKSEGGRAVMLSDVNSRFGSFDGSAGGSFGGMPVYPMADGTGDAAIDLFAKHFPGVPFPSHCGRIRTTSNSGVVYIEGQTPSGAWHEVAQLTAYEHHCGKGGTLHPTVIGSQQANVRRHVPATAYLSPEARLMLARKQDDNKIANERVELKDGKSFHSLGTCDGNHAGNVPCADPACWHVG